MIDFPFEDADTPGQIPNQHLLPRLWKIGRERSLKSRNRKSQWNTAQELSERSQNRETGNGARDGNTDDQGNAKDNNPTIKMGKHVHRQVNRDLCEGRFRVERAGILLGPVDNDDLVTSYVPDHFGTSTATSFTINASVLNRILRSASKSGLDLKGIIHSHPPGIRFPSVGDTSYVADLFALPKNGDAKQIMLPICCDGRIFPYLIDRRDPQHVIPATLVLV